MSYNVPYVPCAKTSCIHIAHPLEVKGQVLAVQRDMQSMCICQRIDTGRRDFLVVGEYAVPNVRLKEACHTNALSICSTGSVFKKVPGEDNSGAWVVDETRAQERDL